MDVLRSTERFSRVFLYYKCYCSFNPLNFCLSVFIPSFSCPFSATSLSTDNSSHCTSDISWDTQRMFSPWTVRIKGTLHGWGFFSSSYLSSCLHVHEVLTLVALSFPSRFYRGDDCKIWNHLGCSHLLVFCVLLFA